MTVAGSDFQSPDLLADDPAQQAAALACLRRHDALDLAQMLGLDGCSPMGVNARGVPQCSDGHGDYPDACASALCAPATGSRRADCARRVRRTRAEADDAQRGAE